MKITSHNNSSHLLLALIFLGFYISFGYMFGFGVVTLAILGSISVAGLLVFAESLITDDDVNASKDTPGDVSKQ